MSTLGHRETITGQKLIGCFETRVIILLLNYKTGDSLFFPLHIFVTFSMDLGTSWQAELGKLKRRKINNLVEL